MEPSKPWPEVVRLGQRIVHELGSKRDFDTLGRWMAHRVAELIDRAEHSETAEERDTAKQECTDVIMRLWKHRAARSRGRPLAETADFLEKLTATAQELYNPPAKEGDTWIDILSYLRYLQKREEEICLAAALAGISLDNDQEWLQEHPEDLSDDEKRIIRNMIYLQEVLGSRYFGSSDSTSLPPEERTEYALRLLTELQSERQHLRDALKRSGGYSTEEHLESSSRTEKKPKEKDPQQPDLPSDKS
jgi:hypothetical protein